VPSGIGVTAPPPDVGPEADAAGRGEASSPVFFAAQAAAMETELIPMTNKSRREPNFIL
jgi:hypothetical protein